MNSSIHFMNFRIALYVVITILLLGCKPKASVTNIVKIDTSKEWIYEAVICEFRNSEYFDETRKYWVTNEAGTTPRAGSFLESDFFVSGYADSLLLINSKEPEGVVLIEIKDRCGIPGLIWNDRRLLTDEFFLENDYLSFSNPVELKPDQYALYLIVSLRTYDVINKYRILLEQENGVIKTQWDLMK